MTTEELEELEELLETRTGVEIRKHYLDKGHTYTGHTCLPLAPRIVRCQLIEYIPRGDSRVQATDPESMDNLWYQSGAACRDLPSSVPQRLTYNARRFGAD